MGNCGGGSILRSDSAVPCTPLGFLQESLYEDDTRVRLLGGFYHGPGPRQQASLPVRNGTRGSDGVREDTQLLSAGDPVPHAVSLQPKRTGLCFDLPPEDSCLAERVVQRPWRESATRLGVQNRPSHERDSTEELLPSTS